MIARWIIAGFVLLLLVSGAFRFGGQYFFVSQSEGVVWAFIVVPLVMFLITWGLLKILGVEPGDQAEAASVIALPGLAVGTYEINSFTAAFPNLDPSLSGTFSALMFLSYAAVIATGILTSRLVSLDNKV
jgi:hypothetical protein